MLVMLQLVASAANASKPAAIPLTLGGFRQWSFVGKFRIRYLTLLLMTLAIMPNLT